ncbi:MAG: GntR family transcriptional regulator [Variovorax sp.]|nr:MAG: GntR family transcriptional regulator [Variovorax sp.]
MRNTLYAQVAQSLTQGIRSGLYPEGSLLPTELALCELYGTSRPTIRAALGELQSLGMVSRRKRVGTRVEGTSGAAGYTQSLASLEDLTQIAAHQKRLVQKSEVVVADAALAAEIGCAAGSRWVRLDMLRLGAEEDPKHPIGVSRVYVDAAYAEIPKLLRKSPRALISTLIENHYGRRIAEVEQTVQAVAVSDELAGTLDAPRGSPALKIVRRYLDRANEMVEATVTLHPGDRLVSKSRLSRRN